MKVEVTEDGLRVYDDTGRERCRAADMKAAGVQIAGLIEELDRLRRKAARNYSPADNYD